MKKLMSLPLFTLLLGTVTASTSFAHDAGHNKSLPLTTAPSHANVYIITPLDGATVSETFTVKFGLQGMGVSPAGIEKKNTGHHHLLVDGKKSPAFNKPMGKGVKHFGGGQTQTDITLTKGTHTLQLILGDHRHIPHDPVVASKKITVTVK